MSKKITMFKMLVYFIPIINIYKTNKLYSYLYDKYEIKNFQILTTVLLSSFYNAYLFLSLLYYLLSENLMKVLIFFPITIILNIIIMVPAINWLSEVKEELNINYHLTSNLTIKVVRLITLVVIISIVILLIWYKYLFNINNVFNQWIVSLFFVLPLLIYIVFVLWYSNKLKQLFKLII